MGTSLTALSPLSPSFFPLGHASRTFPSENRSVSFVSSSVACVSVSDDLHVGGEGIVSGSMCSLEGRNVSCIGPPPSVCLAGIGSGALNNLCATTFPSTCHSAGVKSESVIAVSFDPICSCAPSTSLCSTFGFVRSSSSHSTLR